jgi:AraC family transcriptional regulator
MIQYEARLERVLDYIHDHLTDDLDMAALADVACLSQYHWHRIYRGVTGETLANTVRRLRLHRAAGDLLVTRRSIPDIAETWGYSEVAAFTRAFAAAYGMPPRRYREAGQLHAFEVKRRAKDISMQDVEIVTIEAIQTVGLPHAGAYMTIGRGFDKLWSLLNARRLVRGMPRILALYYDDPNLVAEADLRSFACVNMSHDVDVAAPLETRVIEGGCYAVATHKGPYAELHTSYDALYGGWLPPSGRQVRDAPAFEEYLNDPRSTAPSELLTRIYLPLA